ncbi:MAG: ribosome small subunit-dependent GTPase A [Bacteroidales bacterium]|nr:ribosome small subunit-dependent GTPase A [Bacteroidales bacterium]
MKSGLVLKTTGSRYTIRDNDGKIYFCSIRGKLRLKGVKTTNPITVGDYVDFEVDEGDVGAISRVHDRKNYIIRRSTNLSRESHVIAANLDQTLLIITIEFPETQLAFIDRYLVTAEAYRIPTTLVFNKTDLYTDEMIAKLNDYISIYSKIGYPCIQVSAETGQNLAELRNILTGKVSLISGNSGVGKSTLINKISPELNLKTELISSYHLMGKHTTTFSEMFELSFGGFIIDTPGIKGFGLVDIENDELYHYFPEIFKIASDCKFYNCTHIHEPGCAVIRAVDEGVISPSRYISYLSIHDDDNEKYR